MTPFVEDAISKMIDSLDLLELNNAASFLTKDDDVLGWCIEWVRGSSYVTVITSKSIKDEYFGWVLAGTFRYVDHKPWRVNTSWSVCDTSEPFGDIRYNKGTTEYDELVDNINMKLI